MLQALILWLTGHRRRRGKGAAVGKRDWIG